MDGRSPFWAVCSASVLAWTGCSEPGERLATSSGEPSGHPIRFVDVTEDAGLDFRHSNGGTGRHYYVETMSGGCAFLDFDGDGWLDILLLQGAPLPGFNETRDLMPGLYRNVEGRRFEDITAGSGLDVELYGMGVAVGDYDNDGRADIYITALGGNRLFHNEGEGRFADITAEAGVGGADLSTGAAWIDYDHDGRLDLFVCRYMDYSLESDPVCHDAQERPAYCTPHVYAPTHSLLFHNDGGGRFSDATEASGIGSVTGRAFGAACADYDGDGWIDLFVSNDLTPNFLFLNNGDGTFREFGGLAGVAYGERGVARAGMGVDCGDYDNDGWTDLVVTNFESEPNSLFRNEAGLFQEKSHWSGLGAASLPYVGWGCGLVDLDHDGFQDLFVVNGHVNDYADEEEGSSGYAQPCLVLRNEENGTFSDITASCGPFFSRRLVARGTAFGDYDNDSDLDVLIACNNSAPVLLRNDSQTERGRVQVRLLGTGCNRDALGARVRLQTDALTQIQYVRSGGSCLADHDRRLVFGLDDAHHATLDIRWPCGGTQQLDLEAGQTLRVSEEICLRKPNRGDAPKRL